MVDKKEGRVDPATLSDEEIEMLEDQVIRLFAQVHQAFRGLPDIIQVDREEMAKTIVKGQGVIHQRRARKILGSEVIDGPK